MYRGYLITLAKNLNLEGSPFLTYDPVAFAYGESFSPLLSGKFDRNISL